MRRLRLYRHSFGDRIVSGEVLDRFAETDVDERRVYLVDLARLRWLQALGQAAGVALLAGQADAPARGLLAQGRTGVTRPRRTR